MPEILPPGLSASQFRRALAAFEKIVGSEWVLATEEDQHTYLDGFSLLDRDKLMPAGGVSPASVEELRGILAVANEHKIPFWPVSTGKNLAYGGSNPRMRGTMVLDLIRMNRVLEVNEELGYCVVEPGVSYYDMEKHLDSIGSNLWMSLPAPGWGSLMGNALERGVGYTPYGEHADNICGMEIMLPNGEIIRTGMGAMSGNQAWHLYKYGYGPSWDGAFMQSNFGVVTKVGMWLMPAPKASARVTVNFQDEKDLARAVEVMRPLRLNNIINSNATIASPVRRSAVGTMQRDWYDGEGHMPKSVLTELVEKQGFGWWGLNFTLMNQSTGLVDEQVKLVRAAFSSIESAAMTVDRWDSESGEGRSPKPTPGLGAFQMLNWRGGPGGHVDFSPVLPTVGEKAWDLYELVSSSFYRHGFDYFGGFVFAQRFMINTSVIIYNKNDANMRENAMNLFSELVEEAGKRGYGGYRTHIAFMDEMAEQFTFNEQSLMRFNERMKAAIDPQGIIAPGKNGIWPEAYKGERG